MVRSIDYSKYTVDHNEDDRIIRISDVFTSLTGYSNDDIKNNKISVCDIIPVYEKQGYYDIICPVTLESEKCYEHDVLCKNGSIIRAGCYEKVYMDEETGHLCSDVIIMNVSERNAGMYGCLKEEMDVQFEKIKYLIEDSREIFLDYDIGRDYFEISQIVNGKYKIIIAKHNYLKFLDENKTVHEDDLKEFKEAILMGNAKRDKNVVDVRSRLFTGKYVWYRVTYAKYDSAQTGNSHIVGRIVDINSEKTQILDAKRKSGIDELTRVYNRVAIEEKVNGIIKDQPQENHMCILVDFDNFTTIREKIGKEAADGCLKKAADVLLELFTPEIDSVGRVGVDAFMVFIRNSTDIFYVENKCKIICERLKQEFEGKNGKIRLTVSIGIGVTRKKVNTFVKLLKSADRAMQNVKTAGGDGFDVNI